MALDQFGWSIVWTGSLRSFLVGRHNVNADVSGDVRVPGNFFITDSTWSGTTINYGFGESSNDVMGAGGSTGVADLGNVSFSTPSGAFWNANLHMVLQLADGTWTCTVGPPGAQVTATGVNVVTLNYPIAWTPVISVLAEGIRNQFRRASRIAVLGSLQDGEIFGLAGKCVDVTGGFLTEGNPIELWTCGGGANQHWTVFNDGTIRSLGHCLDVHFGSTAPGTLVDLAACNGTPAQQWTITPAHQLINPHSGQCLDAPGFSSADGTQLQIWPCNGGANQAWWITE